MALVTSGRPGTVECSAYLLVDILHQTLETTLSRELKLAMCELFLVILKCCPSYAEQPELLFPLLPFPEVSFPLSYCVQQIVECVPALRAPCKGMEAPGEPQKGPSEQESAETASAGITAVPEQGARTRSKRRRIIQEDSEKDEDEAAQQRPSPERVDQSKEAPDDTAEAGASGPRTTCLEEAQAVVKRIISHILACGPNGQVRAEVGVEGALTALRVLARPLSRTAETACSQALESTVFQWVAWAVNKVSRHSRHQR